MKINPWETLERKTTLRAPPWLDVESHRLKLPNGRIIDDWQWIKTPDFVNVVAVTEEGLFICFRQQKYAVKGVTLAITGGYVDSDETFEVAAARELREETGYCSEKWTPLGSYAVDGNRGCGQGHLFLAEECTFVGGQIQDDLEDQEMLLLTRTEVEQRLHNAEFAVMPWATALALALLRLR